jgi:hypothetical protein
VYDPFVSNANLESNPNDQTHRSSGRRSYAQDRSRDSHDPRLAIFRQTYRYPQIKFSDIGRKCFAWALRQAWVECREAARVAAMTPISKADRIETLQALIAYAGFIDSGPQWKATIRGHRDEIRRLQAA